MSTLDRLAASASPEEREVLDEFATAIRSAIEVCVGQGVDPSRAIGVPAGFFVDAAIATGATDEDILRVIQSLIPIEDILRVIQSLIPIIRADIKEKAQ